MTADLTAPIHARLLNLAKARGEDFLGFGPIDTGALAGTVREICDIAVDDGMCHTLVVEEARHRAIRAYFSRPVAH